MRWIIRVFGALAIVAIAALFALFLLPAERIARLVTDQFEAATGREMTLRGDVRPTLWPELGVNTGAVTIANAPWSDAGPMLKAERLSVGVDIVALIRGDIRIKRVEAEAPEILVEIARDGRGNWEFAGVEAADAVEGGAAASGGSDALPAFSLDEAVISGGRVTFVDHAAGTRTELADIDATVRLPDLRGAASLKISTLLNRQRVSLDADIDGFAAFLGAGAVPVRLDARIGGSSVAFDGRAGLTPVAAGGRLDADLADMAAVFGLAGLGAPAIPEGLGRRAGISGDVTFTEAGGVTLRGGTIRLDDNLLTGAVDVALAGRPKITADLAGGALDFAALFGGGPEAGAAAGGEAAAAAGWSREPIDVSAMQAVDAEVALAAESLDLGIAKLGRTRTITTLEGGRAVTEIREMAAYGGALGGSVVVNSRGGLSARASLTGSGVALQPLMQELAGYDRLIGTGDLAVNLLGVGNDMHTLMNSLSGEGALKLGKGELRGLDLVGMLRNLDVGYVGAGQRTIFDGITASFTVTDGVLRNEDLRFLAPLLTASGKGSLGIGAQTIDFRAVPALLEGQQGGGIRVPLMITGTWANPKFRLDLKALAEQELADDVEKLKTTAEEAVKARIEEELGVKVDDLGNVEDVLKQELENRARKGLLDLLQGN